MPSSIEKSKSVEGFKPYMENPILALCKLEFIVKGSMYLIIGIFSAIRSASSRHGILTIYVNLFIEYSKKPIRGPM